MIPPETEGSEYHATQEHFEELYDHVTAFSLMTYDYSNLFKPGPNAPIKWVEQCIKNLNPDGSKRDKILTGLNFYGMEYQSSGGGPILGHELLNLISVTKTQIIFDDSSAEHMFDLKKGYGRNIIFFPTLHSINERLKLIEELGTGISIWEVGQGFDYFYDLF